MRDNIKSEKNKKENKAALKKFVPMLIVWAFIGGIAGGISSFVAHSDLSGSVADMAWLILNIISPWIIITLGVAGYISCCVINKKARQLYEKAILDAGENGEPDEEAIETVENKISRGMSVLSVMIILQMLFFGIIMADLEYFVSSNHVLMIVTVVVFIVGSLVQTKQQQLMVDLEKEMNPSKTGSVYDSKFRDKWEESCDEMEKMMIYKSAYKAYKSAGLACLFLWVITAILSIAFKTGPLPCIAVSIIWLVMTVSYCREAMRLDKGGKK